MVAQILALDGIAHQADDGLDGNAAGDLTGIVATHAIGEHQQADVRIVRYGVLVVLADLAGIGLAHEAQLALEAHSASGTRHILLLC